ncbi:MAG TPA: PAS domain S-box protein [Planctomycetota bacterium]|nr:PAS domain S-box protein [Planctomycetota bacterium]
MLRSQLAAIVESSQDAIIGKTLDGTITSWNAGAEALYGYTPEEILGRPISVLLWPDRADELATIMDRIARGEPVTHYETVRLHKDGSRVDVSVSISPIRDGSGTIVGASAIARDISERNRMEQALREAELRKDELLAILGHELRNPLAGVATGLALLRGRQWGGEEGQRILGTVSEQVSLMSRLVDDLLELTRLVRGRIELRPAAVELSDVVRRAVEATRPLMQARTLDLGVVRHGEPLWLRADPVRLEHILVQVLSYAAAHSEAGGKIRVESRREDGEVSIAVTDTGAGFTEEMQAAIFDPFAQLRFRAAGSQGSGIGLALSRKLAELHGGSLEAHSGGEGKGSTFILRLPSELEAADPRGTATQAGEAPCAPRKRRRILVVDDNQASANLLALFLRERGHQVHHAENGPAALDAAGRFAPEIVLLDLGLPGMDGYEVARRLREAGHGLRIVALTGFGHPDARRRTEEAGFDRHLLKGSDLDDLLAAVDEVA